MKFSTENHSPVRDACPCCDGNRIRLWMQASAGIGAHNGRYDLLRCSGCSHTWVGNPPTPEEMITYYSSEYHEAVGCTGEKTSWRWERQLRVISRFRTGGAILDIGCSSGGFLAHLRGGPWQLFGIEASEESAERARLTTGGQIVSGDVADADLEPNQFDVITCSDVLEHLYDPRATFDRVSHWLKPGGIFYVFVPNISSWEARMFGSNWYGLDLPRHLHHFSSESLKTLAARAGLQTVFVATPMGCYLEQSTSEWLNAKLHKVGISHPQVNLSGPAWIGWRALRKALRLTIEAGYARIASACGAAPSLMIVFKKSTSGTSQGIGNKKPAESASSHDAEARIQQRAIRLALASK